MLKEQGDKVLGMDAIPFIPTTHRLQWEVAQDCYVVLYPEGMVKLNPSSAVILQNCDGEKTVAELIAALEKTYSGADLKEDILKFMEVAYENGWIRAK